MVGKTALIWINLNTGTGVAGWNAFITKEYMVHKSRMQQEEDCR